MGSGKTILLLFAFEKKNPKQNKASNFVRVPVIISFLSIPANWSKAETWKTKFKIEREKLEILYR